VRRPLLLIGLSIAGLLAWRRRSRAGQAEKDLWTEATSTPDLR
jgi:hypothetical protein